MQVAGYGLTTLLVAQGVGLEEEAKGQLAYSGVGLLKSILQEDTQLPPLSSLDLFKPLVLRNTVEAIIDIGSVSTFHRISAWDKWMAILQDEFAPQHIKTLHYSTRMKPQNFACQLKGSLFTDLKRLWELEHVVTRNNWVRTQERLEMEKAEAIKKAKADEEAARRAAEKAARKAARKAANPDDEEEEEEEEEPAEPKVKLSRKEREALEKAEKQKKKEEKERTKLELAQEHEMKTLQFKLGRLLDIARISVQFG